MSGRTAYRLIYIYTHNKFTCIHLRLYTCKHTYTNTHIQMYTPKNSRTNVHIQIYRYRRYYTNGYKQMSLPRGSKVSTTGQQEPPPVAWGLTFEKSEVEVIHVWQFFLWCGHRFLWFSARIRGTRMPPDLECAYLFQAPRKQEKK